MMTQESKPTMDGVVVVEELGDVGGIYNRVDGVEGMMQILSAITDPTVRVFLDFDNCLMLNGKVHSEALKAWVTAHRKQCWILTARKTPEKFKDLVRQLRSETMLDAFSKDADNACAGWPDDVCVESKPVNGGGVELRHFRVLGTGPYNKGSVVEHLEGPIVFLDDNVFNAYECASLVTSYWVDLKAEESLITIDEDWAYQDYYADFRKHYLSRSS